MRVIAWFAVCVLLVGCASIPAEIKTEIDFVDTVVQTAVVELEAESDVAKKADKAERALKRLAPHTDNLRRFAEKGQSADVD